MIIYLEGADCVGKSLLTSRLRSALVSASYDVKMLHAGKPDPNVEIFHQYVVPLHEAITHSTAIILDRWHLGELVYGPLRRGGARLTEGQAAYLDLLMQSYGFSGVLCDARSRQLESCFDRRGDDDPAVKRERLIEERDAFRVVTKDRTNWNWLNVLDLHDDTSWSQALLEIIKRVTPLAPFTYAPARNAHAYVGARWPKALLVGDRRNPADRHTPLPWPFVPWTATSGHWMFQALTRYHVPTGELGFINGQERAPGELRAAWTALGMPPVIALGQYATAACVQAGVPVTMKTNHPQWWRRFKHREGQSFSRIIQGVMR